MLDTLLTTLGLSKGATIGGFLGACVSLLLRTLGALNPLQGLAVVAGGTACAGYITPLVIELGSLSQRTESAIAFLIGAFGLVFAAAIVKEAPEVLAAARKRFLGS